MFLAKYATIIGLFLISTSTKCQTVSKEFIRGKWKSEDTSAQVILIYEFINDSNCTQTITNPSMEIKLKAIYNLKDTGQLTIFDLKPLESNSFETYSLIKRVGRDTIKIQGGFYPELVNEKNSMIGDRDPYKWDNNENEHTTGILIRVKK